MITPGSWPDWIAAVFTSLAFVVAAISYARSVRVREEAQARLVYSYVLHVEEHEAGAVFDVLPRGAQSGTGGGGTAMLPKAAPTDPWRQVAVVPVIQMTAVIHNGSDELIGPAKLQVVNSGRGKVLDDFSMMAGSVRPHSDHIVDFVWPNADYPGSPSTATTVIFRDASGSWWRRHMSEPIESVHDDPENAAWTAKERAGWAANARAMGLDPSPEPQPSFRVRWHRWKRARRGKSPIP
jgi:hypothetical protein